MTDEIRIDVSLGRAAGGASTRRVKRKYEARVWVRENLRLVHEGTSSRVDLNEHGDVNCERSMSDMDAVYLARERVYSSLVCSRSLQLLWPQQQRSTDNPRCRVAGDEMHTVARLVRTRADLGDGHGKSCARRLPCESLPHESTHR